MKYLIQIFIFFTINQVLAQDITLKLVSNVWPPFTNAEGKSAVATDLVAEALKRSDIALNNKILVFEDVLKSIDNSTSDGSPALWKSEDREEYMLFSEPYLYNQLILVGKEGSDVDVEDFSELEGKKIAVVASYEYGQEMDDVEGVEFIAGKNDQANLNKLLKGEVDYILVDALLIQFLIKYQPDDVKEYLEIGKKSLIVRPLHFVLRKNYPNAEKIMADFNREILNMKSDGTYHKILHLNWIRTDIDGDGNMELVLGGTSAGKVAPASGYNLMSTDITENDNMGYYIDGKRYASWETVPDKYKVDMDVIRYDFDFMSFNF